MEFICPITLEVMQDPCSTEMGYTYERFAIEKWLRTHDTDPKTNARLKSKTLTPNIPLRVLIREEAERNAKPSAKPSAKKKRAWCREKYGADWWKTDKKKRKREAAASINS